MDASLHVLVVDDHREIREPMARHLERHGLRVTAAETATAAHRAHSLPPDSDPLPAGTYRSERWSLDTGRRDLIDEAGVVTPLSSGEFRLLVAPLDRSGMVLSRNRLLHLTRGRGTAPFDRAVDNQVNRLRRKIERDPQNPALIVTLWGDGYRFTGEVER